MNTPPLTRFTKPCDDEPVDEEHEQEIEEQRADIQRDDDFMRETEGK